MIRHITKAIVLLTIAVAGVSCARGEAIKPDEPADVDATRAFEGENLVEQARVYTAGERIYYLTDGDISTYLKGKNLYAIIEFGGIVSIDRIFITNVVNWLGGRVEIKLDGKEVGGRFFSTNSMEWVLQGTNADLLEIRLKGDNTAIGEIAVTGEYIKRYPWSAEKGEKYNLTERQVGSITISGAEASKGNYSKAIDLNLKLLEEDPRNPYANMNLGQIYIDMRRMTEAESEYVEYLSEGIKRLENADIAENPERKKLMEYLASLYKTELLGEEKSSEYHRKALEIEEAENPDRITVGEVRNWAGIAGSLANQGKFDEEMEYKEKIYQWVKENEVSPDDGTLGWALFRYSVRLRGREMYEKAYEVAKLVYEKFPNTEEARDGSLHLQLGITAMALSRWEEAIDAWKGSINMTAYKANARLLLIAYCYYKLGLTEKMEKYFYLAQPPEEAEFWREFHNVVRTELNSKYPDRKYKNNIEFIEAKEEITKNILSKYGYFPVDKNEIVTKISLSAREYLIQYNIEIE